MDITVDTLGAIDNKKITFDLNGYNLTLTAGLSQTSSDINYQGTGTFTASNETYGLWLRGGSCKLTGATSTDTASTDYAGVYTDSHADVTVNGDVSSQEIGVWADSSKVTVNGNITSSNLGICVVNGGTVSSEAETALPAHGVYIVRTSGFSVKVCDEYMNTSDCKNLQLINVSHL